MINQNPYTSFRVVRRLFTDYVTPYIILVIAALSAMIVTAIMYVVIIKISKNTVDLIFVKKSNQILLTAIMATLAFTIKGIAQYYQNYLTRLISQNILRDIQLKLYKHLIYSDMEFLHSFPVAKLMSNFTTDIVLICSAISSCLTVIARHLMTVISLTIYMFTLDRFLSLLAIIIFVIAIYAVCKLGSKIQKIAYVTQEKFCEHIAKLDETFRNIKVVRSSLAENTEIVKAENRTYHILKLHQDVARINAVSAPLMEILNGIAVGIIILYGGSLAAQGQITPGTLTGFLAAFATAYRPLISLLSVNATIQEGISASGRIFNILDTCSVIEHSHISGARDEKTELSASKVEFYNVSLSLNNIPILNNTSFVISSGETVILFGKSGSGKTSIANLMVRFYNYSRGSITLNGKELKDISTYYLRQHIVFVPQEDTLFNATIAENISYNTSNVPLDTVISAAKQSLAHDFITELPQGYNTIIGYQGCNLSTGQKQRIAIARAMFQNPAILILDESTNALDQPTELAIYESIRQSRKGKITLIITHAIHAIRNADKVIILNDGKVSSIEYQQNISIKNIFS